MVGWGLNVTLELFKLFLPTDGMFSSYGHLGNSHSFQGPLKDVCFFQLLRERKREKPNGVNHILNLDTRMIFLKVMSPSNQTCQGSRSHFFGTQKPGGGLVPPTRGALCRPRLLRPCCSLGPLGAAGGTGPASPAHCPSSPGTSVASWSGCPVDLDYGHCSPQDPSLLLPNSLPFAPGAHSQIPSVPHGCPPAHPRSP